MAINNSQVIKPPLFISWNWFPKIAWGTKSLFFRDIFFYKCLCNSVEISSKSFELISLNIMKSSLIFYLVNVTFVLVYCDLSKVFYINNGEKNVCSREFINLSIYAQLHRAWPCHCWWFLPSIMSLVYFHSNILV